MAFYPFPHRQSKDSKRVTHTPPGLLLVTSDDHEAPPSINILYAECQEIIEAEYSPPTGTGAQQFLNLNGYRSGPSDQGSDCFSPSPTSSPSSTASSPFLSASPQSYFNGFIPDPSEYNLNGPFSGSELYSSDQSSVSSFSAMSLSSTVDDSDAHTLPRETLSCHQVYLDPSGRNYLSMPDILTNYSEMSPDLLGVPHNGLRRVSSSPFDRSPNEIIQPSEIPYSTQNGPMEATSTSLDSIPIQILGGFGSSYADGLVENHANPTSPPRGSSLIPGLMKEIQDLIEQDLLDGKILTIDQLVEAIFRSTKCRHILKRPKDTVASHAGRLASDARRKHPAPFTCFLQGCDSTFTRKLGLKNHIKSHLGIFDLQCKHCERLLPNSLARHEKRCKKNPDRETTRKKNGQASRSPPS